MERAQHLQSVPRYVQHYRRFNCGSPSVDLDLIRCVDLFLGASDEIGPDVFAAAAAKLCYGPHGIVMDAADRNLAVVMLQERPPVDEIAATMRQLAACLEHLHFVGQRIHGDFKPLNAMRMETNEWKLIDLDASALIDVERAGEAEDHEAEHAGAGAAVGPAPTERWCGRVRVPQVECVDVGVDGGHGFFLQGSWSLRMPGGEVQETVNSAAMPSAKCGGPSPPVGIMQMAT